MKERNIVLGKEKVADVELDWSSFLHGGITCRLQVGARGQGTVGSSWWSGLGFVRGQHWEGEVLVWERRVRWGLVCGLYVCIYVCVGGDVD